MRHNPLMPDEARGERARILSLFGSRVIFGAERESIEVLAALKRQGCEVLCLVRHEGWNTAVPAALTARGFAVTKTPYIDNWLRGWVLWVLVRNPIAFVAANWVFWRTVRRFRPTHIHAFNSFYVLSFLPALLVTRTPLMYRAGDVPTRHRWIWRALWQFVVWRTRRFLAVSEFIKSALVASGVPADRIEVIYGIPPARNDAGRHFPAKWCRASFHQETTPGIISSGNDARHHFVFVGQLIADKGPDLLFDAFRTIAAAHLDARLIFAGRLTDDPVDAWARGLRDRVNADASVRDRVAFTGFVEDVPGLLADRLALVVPSRIPEALGLVVLEAKAAGLPAIVFPAGALPELVENGVDGLVCPAATVDALAAAMRTYLDNPALAERHGAAARASLARNSQDSFDSNVGRAFFGVSNF